MTIHQMLLMPTSGFVGFALDTYDIYAESTLSGKSVNFHVSANGTYHATAAGGVSTSGAFSPINWTNSSPTTYYVYAALLVGDTPGGDTTNTWLSLSSDRSWGLTGASGVSKSASLNVKLSTTSSDAGILDYALVNLDAVDNGP